MLHLVAVGIDSYRDERIPALHCAANDARAMARLYRDGIVDGERNVQLLLDEQATRESIMSTIGQQLAVQARREDVVLLYFACHGSPEQLPLQNAGHYLIAHDTRYDAIYATAIDLASDLTNWITRISSQLTMIILDTCFSGAAGGRGFLGPHLLTERARGAALRGPASIAKLKLGKGRVVIAASSDEQLAREDMARGHGVFTAHLLSTLAEHIKPSESNAIDIGKLYTSVHDRVEQDTSGAQTPVMKGELMGAKLPLPAG